MREKISIRYRNNAWHLIIPGFGFNTPTVKEFARWPNVIDYLDTLPGAGYGSCERASTFSDGIAIRSVWSPLHGE